MKNSCPVKKLRNSLNVIFISYRRYSANHRVICAKYWDLSENENLKSRITPYKLGKVGPPETQT